MSRSRSSRGAASALWLEIGHAASRWTFEFSPDSSRAVAIGAAPDMDVRLTGTPALAFFVERGSSGLQLVPGYAGDLRLNFARVRKAAPLPERCWVEVAGQRLELSVTDEPPRERGARAPFEGASRDPLSVPDTAAVTVAFEALREEELATACFEADMTFRSRPQVDPDDAPTELFGSMPELFDEGAVLHERDRESTAGSPADQAHSDDHFAALEEDPNATAGMSLDEFLAIPEAGREEPARLPLPNSPLTSRGDRLGLTRGGAKVVLFLSGGVVVAFLTCWGWMTGNARVQSEEEPLVATGAPVEGPQEGAEPSLSPSQPMEGPGPQDPEWEGRVAVAAKKLTLGHHEQAASLYAELARAQPEERAWSILARLLRARIADRCRASETLACPDILP